MDTFGERLKTLRINQSLSQTQLGEIFDLHQSTIGSYERDQREPDIKTIIGMAQYFNVSTDYLLGKDDDTRTVSQALQFNQKELREFLRSDTVMFNGIVLTKEDKQRVLDILTGYFWRDSGKL